MTLAVLDANNQTQQLSTTVNANDGGLVGSLTHIDPVNFTRQNVNKFGAALVSFEGSKPTYRYSGSLIPDSRGATDFLIIQGSAVKTGRIKYFYVSGTATGGASAVVPITLLRRSSANVGGVLTPVIGGAHDIHDPAPTCSVSICTTNPTALGTLVANLKTRPLMLNGGASQPIGPVEIEFCKNQDKAMILRGASDFICLNGNGVSISLGMVLSFEIELGRVDIQRGFPLNRRCDSRLPNGGSLE